MPAGVFNLAIDKGATFTQVFRLVYRVKAIAAVPAGGTILKVPPLPVAYPSGTIFNFGNVAATLTADADIGGEVLSVTVSGAIAKGATAKGKALDLTELTARAKMRQTVDGVATIFNCAIADAANGVVQVSLSSVATTVLTPNIEAAKAAELKAWAIKNPVTKDDLKLFKPGMAPYYWDLETTDGAPVETVERRLTGRVLVSEEVTYD